MEIVEFDWWRSHRLYDVHVVCESKSALNTFYLYQVCVGTMAKNNDLHQNIYTTSEVPRCSPSVAVVVWANIYP